MALSGLLPTECGGCKTPPWGSFSLPILFASLRARGPVMSVYSRGGFTKDASLSCFNTFTWLQHLFLQEPDAQIQRKVSVSPQRQKFQEQWCILEFRKLSCSVSYLSEHLFPHTFVCMNVCTYLYVHHYLKVLTVGKMAVIQGPPTGLSIAKCPCQVAEQGQVSGSESVIFCLLNHWVVPAHQSGPGEPCMAGVMV